MKQIHTEILINDSVISHDPRYISAVKDIRKAIKSVVWPIGSKKFSIRPGKHINGVVPIKKEFVATLVSRNWEPEVQIDVEATSTRPGKIDAVKAWDDDSYIAAEWETGNISSSHRSINKMLLGIRKGILKCGFLVVPTRKLYPHVTDRIGNDQELKPYYPLWKTHNLNGVLSIISVEHDKVDNNVVLIPKGRDGNAKK